MPDMDGLALLRAIRQSDLDVPMMFMTGSPALESAVQAIEYGAFRYLVKPVAPAALLDVVARAVARAQAREGAARGRARARARGQAHRRPRRPRGAVRLGAREAVGRGAADRHVGGRQTFAYETLLRTDEPTLRSPLDFFDAAERLGRARRARPHHPPAGGEGHEGHATAPVFVNLHPSDLEDDELYADEAR